MPTQTDTKDGEPVDIRFRVFLGLDRRAHPRNPVSVSNIRAFQPTMIFDTFPNGDIAQQSVLIASHAGGGHHV